MLVLMRSHPNRPIFSGSHGDRYWNAQGGANGKPGMPKSHRQKLIQRKYVFKYWIPRSDEWEVELQKKHPLAPDELAILGCINLRKSTTDSVPATASDPLKPDRGQGGKENQPGQTSEARLVSPEARWSNEIVCSGRRVVLLKCHNYKSSSGWSSTRSEKVINDGRMGMMADPTESYDHWAKFRAGVLGERDWGGCDGVLEGENEPLGIKVLEPFRAERMETILKVMSSDDLIDLAGTSLGECEMATEQVEDLIELEERLA